MPEYRRYLVAGASYFFTLVTDQREPFLCTPAARGALRQAFQGCLRQWPFVLEGVVLLPDHLHAIWTLPPGDDRYPARWAWVKKEFTKSWLADGGVEQPVSAGRERDGRRGVWQPKFWEHLLRDETDFETHLDYIHYNPVKHGYVTRPGDWEWSSFHRWVRRGAYPPDWGATEPRPFDRPGMSFGE